MKVVESAAAALSTSLSSSPSSSSSSSTSTSTSSSLCARHTHTHLTYSRHHLVEIATETIRISESGMYVNSRGLEIRVKADLDKAVEGSVHYGDGYDFRKALVEYDEIIDDDDGGGDGRDDLLLVGSSLASSSSSSSSPSSPVPRQPWHSLRRRRPRPAAVVPGTGGCFPKTSFLVVSASWLESALELLRAHHDERNPSSSSSDQASTYRHHHHRVGVLNSGSGTTPGGRFLKGTVSQEDCLCRASLLYSCISQPKFQSEGRFYGKNRSMRYGTSNCVIFSPDVPVIREDTVEGKLLDSYEKVSFVTIPAPNAFTTSSKSGREYSDIEGDENKKGQMSRNTSAANLTSMSRSGSAVDLASITGGVGAYFDEKFEEKRSALLSSLSDRIHRALSAFVLGGCTDLVLPAFGCGVHGNDPSMVAGVFREMLTDPAQFGGRFRTVVFAVPPCRKQNYQAFAAYFHKSERAPVRPSFLRTVTLN